ncbi:Werner Syndrome-like exonuclease isoform X2 [Formica exsecta]|uniref:Werner Syndrome-like exonuclease isoform X2 n=1 Tax=Formica exsecta TaxID=72781 RepID=UPI00114173B0|nr:Werner Syndrome-like exonuclease isoform X2 [Formica exsecta]
MNFELVPLATSAASSAIKNLVCDFHSRISFLYQDRFADANDILCHSIKHHIDKTCEKYPPIVFKGCIEYATEFVDCAFICNNLIEEINRSEEKVIPLGFDLEWPFNFQTGSGKTALVQICLDVDVCYLLHIYSLNKLPAAFIELLCHSKVILVGVNIKNDLRKLERDFKEFPAQKVVENNCLDCGPFANQRLNRSGRWSLERLTALVLKKKISKNPEVRRSKWHVQPLSDAQKIYAATDAYVSLLIYRELHNPDLLK